MKFSRDFGFPSLDTFDCPPIGSFVKRYLSKASVSVDPFSRNKVWATETNDLNVTTMAKNHMDGIDFMLMLHANGVIADLVILDPPYSPRQVKECYQDFGMQMTQKDGWTSAYLKRLAAATNLITMPGSVTLTFGWNSRLISEDWSIEEILLVNHGSAHNDTICTAQIKIQGSFPWY